MSRNRQHSPNRIMRRPSRSRRAWFEDLEQRACPAVTFEFIHGDAGGILRVTGDEGPNTIELFQPRDGVVEVTGDGEQRIFEGVDEIFVATLGGDDAAHSSKPKEIVVVGSKLHLDMGAGNDRVKLDNVEPAASLLLPRVNWEVAVDLGTGADEISVEAGNVDALNLEVRSADGGDQVAVGHTVGLRHEHTRPEARIDIDLGGGGNFVEVRLNNVEDVDLAIAAEPAPAAPARGGTVNVYWHIIKTGGSASGPRMDGVVILSSSLPGGSTIGVSPTSLSFTATAGGAGASLASVALDLGSDDDTVSILGDGVDNLDLDLRTGGGDDVVIVMTHVDGGTRQATFVVDLSLGSGSDLTLLEIVGYRQIDATIDSGPAGDGRDAVIASFRLSLLERTRRIRRLVDSGLDRVELLVGVGYDVQMTSGETAVHVLLVPPPAA